MKSFGELLRQYRQRCIYPGSGGKLTQEQLGRLLGEALGFSGYSGAAVSDWENGKSQIDKDHRQVLINLIKIMHICGGLETDIEADAFLWAGNYRSLSDEEKARIFPNLTTTSSSRSPTNNQPIFDILGQLLLMVNQWRGQLSADLDEFTPIWGEKLLNFLGLFFDRWNSQFFLYLLAWLGIWWLNRKCVFPLMDWPFQSQPQIRILLIIYAGASILLPAAVGLLISTREDPFWKKQNIANNFIIRFYTHLGASVGFHVGLMMIFIIKMTAYYLGIRSFSPWLYWLHYAAVAWPIILAGAAAKQIPFNLWRAYGRLHISDGAIFSIFFLFGPILSIFFYYSYSWLTNPLTGIPIIILFLICYVIFSTKNKL